MYSTTHQFSQRVVNNPVTLEISSADRQTPLGDDQQAVVSSLKAPACPACKARSSVSSNRSGDRNAGFCATVSRCRHRSPGIPSCRRFGAGSSHAESFLERLDRDLGVDARGDIGVGVGPGLRMIQKGILQRQDYR